MHNFLFSKHFVFRLLFGLFYCSIQTGFGQEPIAKFSFNSLKDYDEINKTKAKLVGVRHTADRFGNENSAIFLSGNNSSYVNLGSYLALKPKSGSISLWVKMEHAVWYGIGAKYNPLIITKCNQLDDFYESFAIYYMLETERIVVTTVQDSTQEVALFSRDQFRRNSWQHIVVTFDYDTLSLYMNGSLMQQLPKKFETHYMASDSVVLGNTANKKNNRFFNGSIDDVEFYDHVLNKDEVNALYHAPDPNHYKIIVYRILKIFALFILIVALHFVIKYRVKRAVQKEKKRLEFYHLVLETELRVNRALMNPHFIFNSLNTLQNFILKNDNHIANDYLVEFSKLLRKTLESNNSGIISLELELELLKRYIDIENLRFEKNILYSIHVDPQLSPSRIHIPIMMLQPFVENAIWHGLLSKEGDKVLTLSILFTGNQTLKCIIEDNGLGRKKRTSPDPEKKSLGIGFIKQRLALLNKMHGLDCTLVIEDKENNMGTAVIIILPILNK